MTHLNGKLAPQEEEIPPFDPAWVLAEILRLRAWLKVISSCNSESSQEDRYARRIKYIARRALNGDEVR